jgi:multicomponent Na+:H+ antiporter subunit F
MFSVPTIIILISIILAVYRALKGPTVFDRLLAANVIGTGTVIFLALYGFLTGRPDFLDIGLTYLLLNLVGTLAVLKYFRYGSLAHGEEE